MDRRSANPVSEIKTDLHMGIVTATESQADRREVYFPANERAMAHYAYASPDRKSVVEASFPKTMTLNFAVSWLPPIFNSIRLVLDRGCKVSTNA